MTPNKYDTKNSLDNLSPAYFFSEEINNKLPTNSPHRNLKLCGCDHGCTLGDAGFNGTKDQWYSLEVPLFPDTVILSLDRTRGFVRGDVILTPTGLKIDEPGSYWASFSAVIENPDEASSIVLPLFLSANNTFDPANAKTQLSEIGTIKAQGIMEITGDGLLTDVKAGTEFSILVTNGGSPLAEAITIKAWDISIYKICD